MTIPHPAIHVCSAFPRLQDGSCSACRTGRLESVSFSPLAVTPKTAGVAVLLSLLWLGAGHLYADRIATGIVLIVADALLGCLALTGVGLVVAVPVWLVLAPIVATLSAHAVTVYNQRNEPRSR